MWVRVGCGMGCLNRADQHFRYSNFPFQAGLETPAPGVSGPRSSHPTHTAPAATRTELCMACTRQHAAGRDQATKSIRPTRFAQTGLGKKGRGEEGWVEGVAGSLDTK